jgi:hypothetical protein
MSHFSVIIVGRWFQLTGMGVAEIIAAIVYILDMLTKILVIGLRYVSV